MNRERLGDVPHLQDIEDLLDRYAATIRPAAPDGFADRVMGSLGLAPVGRSWLARLATLGMRSMAPAAAAVTIALAGGAATVALVADTGQLGSWTAPAHMTGPSAEPSATPSVDPRDVPVLVPAPSPGRHEPAEDQGPSDEPSPDDPSAPSDDDGGATPTPSPMDEPDDGIDGDAVDDDEAEPTPGATLDLGDDPADEEGPAPTADPTDEPDDLGDETEAPEGAESVIDVGDDEAVTVSADQ